MDIPRANGSADANKRAMHEERRHGTAALLLIESLMHALLEKDLISRDEFVETVESAAEVEDELNVANASLPSDSNGSVLYPLATAFRKELGR
jgi:hypothetical protein